MKERFFWGQSPWGKGEAKVPMRLLCRTRVPMRLLCRTRTRTRVKTFKKSYTLHFCILLYCFCYNILVKSFGNYCSLAKLYWENILAGKHRLCLIYAREKHVIHYYHTIHISMLINVQCIMRPYIISALIFLNWQLLGRFYFWIFLFALQIFVNNKLMMVLPILVCTAGRHLFYNRCGV